MQGKQGQAGYKYFRLLCPSQNIGNYKFRGSIFQEIAIKGGGRPTRLLPHAKMLLIPTKLFLAAG